MNLQQFNSLTSHDQVKADIPVLNSCFEPIFFFGTIFTDLDPGEQYGPSACSEDHDLLQLRGSQVERKPLQRNSQNEILPPSPKQLATCQHGK